MHSPRVSHGPVRGFKNNANDGHSTALLQGKMQFTAKAHTISLSVFNTRRYLMVRMPRTLSVVSGYQQLQARLEVRVAEAGYHLQSEPHSLQKRRGASNW